MNERQEQKTKLLFNKLFKINGNPAGSEMSKGQLELATAVMFKVNPRIASLAPTGYGKSEAIALATIVRTALMDDNFIIGSIKLQTSEMIMQKILTHIFDSQQLVDELEIDDTQRLDNLRRERNKSHITFRGGGSVKIVSFHGADMDVSAAIGEHVPNIILDESPLLTPTQYLQVLKILEGTGDYNKTFLVELGNATNRNHFMRNIKFNPDYLKFDITLQQALDEGRLDIRSVDEKRGLPFFKQFYECQFPQEDEIDAKGYRQLTNEETIHSKLKLIDKIPLLIDVPIIVGADIAGGGDYNVFCCRQSNVAWFETYNRSNDTMTNVTEIQRLLTKYDSLIAENIYIDNIGIGRGVSDRLIKELNLNINDITVGMKSSEPLRYMNQKAEYYWHMKEWLERKDTLLYVVKNDTIQDMWQQLSWIKYKSTSDKVLQIEPKQELKSRTGKSPDFAESFMLTFANQKPIPGVRWL